MDRWTRAWSRIEDATVRRYAKAMTVSGLFALVPYLAILWDLRFDPLRTARPDGQFSSFYDVQARALLDGSLSVPSSQLGIEAFVIDGQNHMYFPPGPALARLPLLAVTHALDGKLTAISMLLAWLAGSVLVSLLLWRTRRMLRGDAELGRAEAAAYGLLLVGATAGSVLLYLGSLPWVYHEAYAWATVMALGWAFALLGVLEDPRARRVVATGLFVLGALLSRTTTGLAGVGATAIVAVWFLSGRRGERALRCARGLFFAALLPLSVAVTINEAKFDHPFLFPLEKQVWTEVNEQRRRTLDANGGDLVSAAVLPDTISAYFRPDGVRFTDVFPFITLPAEPPAAPPGGHLDQTYRTGSAVACMPALFLLAAWGTVTTFRRRAAPGAALLRVPLLGTGAISGAIMIFGYISYRYTSELVPFLVLASGVGFVDLARRFDDRPPIWRRRAVLGLGAVIAFSVAAHTAIGFAAARTTTSGADLQAYVRAQDRISSITPGDPLGGHIAQSGLLPADGPADRLHIVGDCDGLYLGTGETLWPWMPVELRQLDFEVRVHLRPDRDGGPTAIGVPLATVIDDPDHVLRIERHRDQRIRFVYLHGDVVKRSPWREATLDEPSYVTLRPDLEQDSYIVGVDGEFAFYVPISAHNDDWFREQFLYAPSLLAQADLAPAGLEVRPLEPAPLETCRSLQRFEDRAAASP
ncbi:MAG: hypothetical protein Q8K58_12690 [Acidimicrobiales bacterium]|nr:hypothetical protein [Acidimicrobiales bacterium]